jgi:IclR family KDG regulon transcriptional repressor
MGRSVPALNRGLDILELFLDSAELSAPDVAQRLGLPRTTVHELLASLVGRAYLVPVDAYPVRYRLGARLAQLGAAFSDQLDLVQESSVVARDVAAVTGETANVGILDGVELVYVVKVESPRPVRMVSAVGRRLPAHCTSLGKVLLAALPDQVLAERIPPGDTLVGMTSHSITSARVLHDHLRTVRRDGFAVEERESDEEVCCVAAPVRDHTGQVVAALSVSAPIMRRTPQLWEDWVGQVRRGADQLSSRLGYRASEDGPAGAA